MSVVEMNIFAFYNETISSPFFHGLSKINDEWNLLHGLNFPCYFFHVINLSLFFFPP